MGSDIQNGGEGVDGDSVDIEDAPFHPNRVKQEHLGEHEVPEARPAGAVTD